MIISLRDIRTQNNSYNKYYIKQITGNKMNWPKDIKKIKYHCKVDSSLQPALTYVPQNASDKRPLLVGLHTWGFGYEQGGGETVYARWCIQNDWLFIHPDFRGSNTKPEAMGSKYVVSDILDAVEYMKENYPVDTERIYLVGVSGGGHAALLMAGLAPDVWAGVSAWCGISDIKKWWKQTKDAGLGYYEQIESACNGCPDTDQAAAKECLKRSPISYLQNAKSVNLDINAGVRDGRDGSVPFSQSLYAFNKVAESNDIIDDEAIEAYYNDLILPSAGNQNISESLYGKHTPLFVKTSSNARVVVFDGGHEIVHLAALNWVRQQRKGVNASWMIDKPVSIDVLDKETKSGK